jgi:hypothetical protein
LLRRDGRGEQQIDSRKYTERVQGLINESIDAIAATDNERRDVLQRWRLPEALGVRPSFGCCMWLQSTQCMLEHMTAA